jgi:hypothetical protein
MTASIQSPADVVNLSLRRIGYAMRVGSLLDGSPAAKTALDIYAQTRDGVLRSGNWDFAEKIIAAVATGNAAPGLWTTEFTYPADCLRLRNMFPAGYSPGNENNPLPILWTIGSSAVSGTKVIWTNQTAASLIYTAQVTSPAQWEPLFVETLAVALGKRLAAALASLDVVKIESEDEKMIAPMAEETLG